LARPDGGSRRRAARLDTTDENVTLVDLSMEGALAAPTSS